MLSLPLHSRYSAWVAVGLLVLINAVMLRHELTITTVDLNDNVYHYTLAARMVEALEAGENPLDCWVSEWSLGYPVSRTYQPLGHLILAFSYMALGKSVPLLTLFVWMRFLLLCLFPFTLYLSCRLLRLDQWVGVAAALVAPLLATNGLYGLEYGSFLWRGSGLYTQAWAMHLLPLSLGLAFRSVQLGRGLVGAGVLLGLTFLAHMIYGYMGALSICLLAILPHPEIPHLRRFVRVVVIGLVSMCLTAFFLIPLLSDRAFINQSRWEESWKWDSYGLDTVTQWLLMGDLFDFGRWPILSLLALGGFGLCLRRIIRNAHLGGSQESLPWFACSYIVTGFILWVAFFGGRPTWGGLMSLLGAGPELHLHRLIGGIHLFGLLLIGIGLGSLWIWGAKQRHWVTRTVILAGSLLLLAPVALERIQYINQNTIWGKENLAAFQAEENQVEAVMAGLETRSGRIYPGLAAGWGGQLKIGQVPLHAFLSTHLLPVVSFLYHSMALTSDIMVRFNEHNPTHYRLFNIETVLADAETPLPPFLFPVARHGRFRLLSAPGNGYFELVSVPYQIQTDKRRFYDAVDPWLASDWPIKRQHLLLDFGTLAGKDLPLLKTTNALPSLSAATGLGMVLKETKTGEHYQAEVHVLRPSYLLFKMTYHPNWQVSVDGQPQPTVPLSPGFVGVAVSPGRHVVDLVYTAEWWKMWMLWGGWGIILFALITGRRSLYARMEDHFVVSAIRIKDFLMAKRLVRPWLIGTGLVLLSFPICFPLLTSQLPGGHDVFGYVPRLVQFHENIRHGILLPRWAPDLTNGYGQPLFLFNPPLLYYVGEIWHLLGFNTVASLNMACVTLVLASGVSMFLLGWLYWGQLGGWFAATAYLYAPYFHVDLYVRHAWAEFCAFPFFPLSMYGFGRFAKTKEKRFLLVGSIGYAAVLVSHNASALLFTPLLLAFLAFTAWKSGSWKILVYQLIGFLIGLSLGAFVWLPSLLELQFVQVNHLLEGYLRYNNHFVFLHQFFFPNWGYGLSVPGYHDGMSFSLGWPQLFLMVVGWLWVRRSSNADARHWQTFFILMTMGLCVLMLPGTQWLWDQLPLLQYVEFPWRLLGPTTVCVALLVAPIGKALSSELSPLKNQRTWIMSAFALLILANVGQAWPDRYEYIDLSDWTPDRIAQRGISVTTRGEYKPRWVEQRGFYRPEKIQILDGTADVRLLSRTPIRWEAEIAAQTSCLLELGSAYFPGWEITIDGESVPIEIADAKGLIRVRISTGHHLLVLQFTRTWPRWLGESISLLMVFTSVGLWWRWRHSAPLAKETRRLPD